MRRKQNKRLLRVFLFFGRLGWTAMLTRDRLQRRTRLGRSIWRTTLLFCSVYAIMFLFLLNLYIEAGLVYKKKLSLQKDRAKKGQELRTFPLQMPKRRLHEFATIPIPLLPYFLPSPRL